MALFTTDYSNLDESNNYEALPKGNYECIITKAEPDATPSGTENISITLQVRSDLDQAMPDTNGKYHKRLIFLNIWKRKKTGKYDANEVNYIMKAIGVPQGTSIATWDDFTDILMNKPVRVSLIVDKSEYNGKTTERNSVFPNGWHETKFPIKGADATTDPFKDSKEATELSDSDIPF